MYILLSLIQIPYILIDTAVFPRQPKNCVSRHNVKSCSIYLDKFYTELNLKGIQLWGQSAPRFMGKPLIYFIRLLNIEYNFVSGNSKPISLNTVLRLDTVNYKDCSF
jgi:hypothetical protein